MFHNHGLYFIPPVTRTPLIKSACDPSSKRLPPQETPGLLAALLLFAGVSLLKCCLVIRPWESEAPAGWRNGMMNFRTLQGMIASTISSSKRVKESGLLASTVPHHRHNKSRWDGPFIFFDSKEVSKVLVIFVIDGDRSWSCNLWNCLGGCRNPSRISWTAHRSSPSLQPIHEIILW